MDVEGAEIIALKGMLKSIKKFKPKMIIEFNPGPIERFYGDSAENLYKILQSNFNKISFIDGQGGLILIEDFKQLMKFVEAGKGWEDLLCEF